MSAAPAATQQQQQEHTAQQHHQPQHHHPHHAATTYAAALASAVNATVDSVAEALEVCDLSTALEPEGAEEGVRLGGGGGGGDGDDGGDAASSREAPAGEGAADGGGGGEDQGQAPASADEAPEDEFDWDQLDIGRLDGGSGSSGTGGAPRSARDRRQQLAALKGRVVNALLHPRHVQLRDKLAFMIGSCQVWAMAYLLGRCPQKFYLFYTAQTLVLMSIRFLLYRKKKMHYYMLDACYYANCLVLLHIWALPRSQAMAKVTYAFNTGPLLWSIAAFRNSLVFHDLDRVTSVFIHLVPSTVSWTLRWHPDTSRFGPPPGAPPEVVRRWQHASLVELVVLPMAPYLAWSVSYYLKIFVWSAEKIRARGYITLFSWVTTTKRGAFAAITRRVPEHRRPQVYLFLHYCFCATTFAMAWLCWHHFALHTLLLTAMGLASLWNGANYYFTVFAARYLKELEQRLAAQEDGSQQQQQPAQAAAAGGPSQPAAKKLA